MVTLAHVLAVATITISLRPAALAGPKYKVLHNFGASGDGTNPWGPPVLDSKGNLYGFTDSGGTGHCSDYGCGIVYELGPRHNGTWSEEVLHDFTDDGKGEFPSGAPIFDTAGNLFGTSVGDTDGTPSTAFELSPGTHGWTHTVLYDNGAGPGLLMDKAGNLYGDIGPGDYYGAGAVGELSSGSNGWNYTQLYSFCNEEYCEDGYGPLAPPIWDRHGNLYDTTYWGGFRSCYCGVAFQMTPNSGGTWTYHILHRFGSFQGDGEHPAAGFVMDAAGSLYGNTVYGGAYDQGTVFKLSRTSGGKWKETALYDFPNCAKGCLPAGTMVFDKAGNLYGVSSGGAPDCGGYTCGVVFKMTPSRKNGKWQYSVVHTFNGTDGDSPAGITLDSKGNIFGTTSMGGTYNWGVAFEITP
jgi:uncharacterized repeat protein (TIGR03803 family)